MNKGKENINVVEIKNSSFDLLRWTEKPKKSNISNLNSSFKGKKQNALYLQNTDIL